MSGGRTQGQILKSYGGQYGGGGGDFLYMGKLQPPFFALFWIFRRRRPCHYYLSSGLISLSLFSLFFPFKISPFSVGDATVASSSSLSFCLCESAYEKKTVGTIFTDGKLETRENQQLVMFLAQFFAGGSESQLHNFGANPIPVSLSF